MRKELSYKYIKGVGIEIGGLHCPLPVVAGVQVTYVDYASAEDIAKANPDVTPVILNNVIDDAEELKCFKDSSLDFVIANHVLEHCENPIKAFRTWLRVLRPGGIIYAAIPDKHHTFDRNRAVTTLNHMVSDYENGPDASLEAHYRDWFSNSLLEGVTGDVLEAKVAASMKARNNIHFHVFDWASLVELFTYLVKTTKDDIYRYWFHVNGSEIITITRKAG